MKYDPSVIEIPVPRYFKDTEDNIDLNIVFVSEVDRGGKKKKKKASKKKKKKSLPPNASSSRSSVLCLA